MHCQVFSRRWNTRNIDAQFVKIRSSQNKIVVWFAKFLNQEIIDLYSWSVSQLHQYTIIQSKCLACVFLANIQSTLRRFTCCNCTTITQSFICLFTHQRCTSSTVIYQCRHYYFLLSHFYIDY